MGSPLKAVGEIARHQCAVPHGRNGAHVSPQGWSGVDPMVGKKRGPQQMFEIVEYSPEN